MSVRLVHLTPVQAFYLFLIEVELFFLVVVTWRHLR